MSEQVNLHRAARQSTLEALDATKAELVAVLAATQQQPLGEMPGPNSKRPRKRMPKPGRRKQKVPSCRLHKASGQAIVTLPDGLGRRRDVLLGTHGTQASRVEYARVIAEWEAAGRRLPAEPAADMTVSELLGAFLTHAESEYPPPSRKSNYKPAMRAMRELYGPTPAAKFGPLALKAVRQRMIDGWESPPSRKHPDGQVHKPLARSLINQRIGRIKRIVKWAVAAEFVPAGVLEACGPSMTCGSDPITSLVFSKRIAFKSITPLG